MTRWLVPLLTILVLVVQSASTWAAAGTKTTVHCCCPSVDVCKCHDHEGGGETSMRRCGGGEHEVFPELAVSTVVDPPPVIEIEVPAFDIEYRVIELSTTPEHAPDKPPF